MGFDPRGVGGSVPALSCDPNFFQGVQPNYIPANAAAEQVLINRAKDYAAACEQQYGWFLPYETTVNTARDMDQIRQAFGVQQMTYYGFSYGTYLGQVYGTLFPDRVRRMVLDSTVDPTGAWYADNISQDYAFQGRIEAFFAWIAQYDSTYHLGSTTAEVQAAYYKLRDRLEKTPIDGPDGPMIGPDELDDTILEGGYLNALWPGLAQALSQYLNNGDSSSLISQFQAYGVQSENEFAVYNAVECADVNWPRNWSKWQSDTEHVYQTAPFEAWDNAWFNAACAFWPVTGPDKPFQVNGAKLPPVLMLQGTLDPRPPTRARRTPTSCCPPPAWSWSRAAAITASRSSSHPTPACRTTSTATWSPVRSRSSPAWSTRPAPRLPTRPREQKPRPYQARLPGLKRLCGCCPPTRSALLGISG